MAIDPSGDISRNLRALFASGTLGDLTDGQLLDQFLRGEVSGSAAAAFEALVRRHGPMVLRVCKGALADAHAADDAFQATFLVLVEKSGSIRNRDSVASWLHGVALRVSAEARASAARRRKHERRGAEMAARPEAREGAAPDPGLDLHREVARLPEKFRAPVVLCHLEGLTHEEAARRLALPVGTVRSRLARGRDRLRSRLERRGFGPAVGSVLATGSPSPLPEWLVASTVRAASAAWAGKVVAAGVVPASVAALKERTVRSMLMNKLLKIAGAAALGLGLAAAGAFAMTRPDDPPKPAPTATANPAEAPLPDRAAVRDALKTWWDSMQTLSFRERSYVALPDGSPDRTKSVGTFDYAHAPGDRRVVRHGGINPRGQETYIQVQLDDGRRQYHVGGSGNYPPSLTFADVRDQTNRGDRFESSACSTLWLLAFAEGPAYRPLYTYIEGGAPLEIARDSTGEPRVVLTLNRMGTDIPIELDPKHGYLPKRLGGFFKTTVTRFTQDNGVWFPAEGSSAQRPGGQVARAFEIVDLKINRPLPADTFTPRPEWVKNATPGERLGRFGPDSLDKARTDPKAPGAVESLVAIVEASGSHLGSTFEAMDLLLKDHLANPKINRATERAAEAMARYGSPKPGEFLRAVVGRASDRAIRARATLHLARYLHRRGEIMRENADYRPQDLRDSRDGGIPARGPIDGLAKGQALIAEAETLYEKVMADYADIASLAADARRELDDLRSFGVGRVAPEIEGTDVDGKPFKLSDYRGKVVLLSFWGDWCPFCRAEYEADRKIEEGARGRPFALLGVNSDPDRAAVAALIRQQGLPGRSWFDGGTAGPIAARWKVKGWPTTYVLDAQGVIRFKGVRGMDAETAVNSLLNEPEAGK